MPAQGRSDETMFSIVSRFRLANFLLVPNMLLAVCLKVLTDIWLYFCDPVKKFIGMMFG